MKRILSIIALFAAISSAWAQTNRIKVSTTTNGSVTVANANPTGTATVTLTVSPDEGYYITASDISVRRTALGAQARRQAPGIDGTKYTVTAATVDDTGKGTYTFSVEEGYGALVEATFKECGKIQPTVSIVGWTYGAYDVTKNAPVVSGNDGNGDVTFHYAKQGTTDYSADVPIKAGDYTIRATVAPTGHYLGGTATADFTVEQAQLTIKADAKSKFFSESDPELTYTLTGLVDGDKISLGLIRELGEDVGSYPISIGSIMVSINYTWEYEGATLTINPKTINTNQGSGSGSGSGMGLAIVELNPEKATYNGKDQKPTINVIDGSETVDPNEYIVSFERDGKPVNDIKDAGTYTIIISDAEGGNYDVSGTATYIVDKKTLYIKALPQKKTYGENDPELTYQQTGLEEGDEIKGKLSRDGGESVGKYDITQGTLSAGENYTISYKGEKLTINPREVNVDGEGSSGSLFVTLNPREYVYDSSAKKPVVTIKYRQIVVPANEYTVTYLNNVDAGTATVIISDVEGGNFTVSGKMDFTIKQATATISFEAESVGKHYDDGQFTNPLKNTGDGKVTFKSKNEDVAKVDAETGVVTISGVGQTTIIATVTDGKNYTYAEPTATYTLTVERGEVKSSDIIVIRNDTDERVENQAFLTLMDDGTLRIDKVHIVKPADASAAKTVSVRVYIPAMLKDYDGKLLPNYGVGSDLLETDPNVPVTDVFMPETEEKLQVAEEAFSRNKTTAELARIHTPLWLLDDYALTAGLKAEYEADKLMTTVTPTTRFWTLSCGVNLLVPDGLTAFTCQTEGTTDASATAITQTTAEVEGKVRPVILANNGVMMSGTPGSYDLKALHSANRPSGTEPPTYDAQDYEGNQLVPALVKTHFEPTEYYILYNNKFHELQPTDDTSVSPCKAVLLKSKRSLPRLLGISLIDSEATDVSPVCFDSAEAQQSWYTLDGRKLEERPTAKGVYVRCDGDRQGVKVVIK